MSAKKPQSDHGKALAAFSLKKITRREYQRCCLGMSFISGNELWDASGWFGWNRHTLYTGRAA